MRGRKPTPTPLKELHGSNKPTNPNEPVPEGALTDAPELDCPEHFSDEQRAVWLQAIENSPPGMLKRVDAVALECWVVAHVLHRQAVRAQSRTSLLHRQGGQNSLPVQSPLIGLINKQALIMAKYAAELGFTPVSRPRIMAGAVPATGRNDNLTANSGRDAPHESIEAYLANAPRPSAIH
jgi:P27 family predicted phage terminase small subunit